MRFSAEFPYETPRVRLVPVQPCHADYIWEWSRDPRFNRHVLWRQPQVRLQAKLFIDSAMAAWQSGVGFSYFGESKETGETLARVEARLSRRRRSLGEVGMLIAPSAWKQGLATELAYFGLWFCFENLELEAVAIDAAAANDASNKLLAGLGMHLLGEQDFPLAEGGCARLNRYVLTRDEFQDQLLPVLRQFAYRLPADAPMPQMLEPSEHIEVALRADIEVFMAPAGEVVQPVGEVSLVAGSGQAFSDAANAELL